MSSSYVVELYRRTMSSSYIVELCRRARSSSYIVELCRSVLGCAFALLSQEVRLTALGVELLQDGRGVVDGLAVLA
jgi:hypothetical protein